MRTRRVLELSVGLGLLLGPLAYALTLTGAPAPDWCAEATVATAPAVEAAAEPSRRCEAEPAPAPEPRAEPRSEAEPELADARAEFLFVTDAGVVLSPAAERDWGRGRLFEPPGEVSYRAAKRADAATLPSDLWRLAGRRYDLYGPEGKLCSARLGELRVVAQYDGWGVAGLLGDDWFEEDPERASPAAIRKALWARDDLWLVAEIAADGPCEGALWARDAELPPPAILRRSDAPNPTTKARLAAFERSDELAATRERYLADYAELAAADPEQLAYYEDWATLVREHGARAWSWLDADGQPRLVGLEFGREPEGCGEWLYSSITGLDHVRGSELEPVGPSTGAGRWPEAVIDVDGDGQLELLYVDEEGRRLVSATEAAELGIDYDWHCPC